MSGDVGGSTETVQTVQNVQKPGEFRMSTVQNAVDEFEGVVVLDENGKEIKPAAGKGVPDVVEDSDDDSEGSFVPVVKEFRYLRPKSYKDITDKGVVQSPGASKAACRRNGGGCKRAVPKKPEEKLDDPLPEVADAGVVDGDVASEAAPMPPDASVDGIADVDGVDIGSVLAGAGAVDDGDKAVAAEPSSAAPVDRRPELASDGVDSVSSTVPPVVADVPPVDVEPVASIVAQPVSDAVTIEPDVPDDRPCGRRRRRR